MTEHSEEDEGRDSFGGERAADRRYSARQRDRMYSIGLAGSSLKISDCILPGIGVRHD